MIDGRGAWGTDTAPFAHDVPAAEQIRHDLDLVVAEHVGLGFDSDKSLHGSECYGVGFSEGEKKPGSRRCGYQARLLAA